MSDLALRSFLALYSIFNISITMSELDLGSILGLNSTLLYILKIDVRPGSAFAAGTVFNHLYTFNNDVRAGSELKAS